MKDLDSATEVGGHHSPLRPLGVSASTRFTENAPPLTDQDTQESGITQDGSEAPGSTGIPLSLCTNFLKPQSIFGPSFLKLLSQGQANLAEEKNCYQPKRCTLHMRGTLHTLALEI